MADPTIESATPPKSILTTDAAWSAVESRDADFDGRFVYAVTSTGIYCRPSCPSRRPRRDRARFFDTTDQAEAAGFRACRRCRPENAARPSTDTVRRACTYIEAHLEEGIRLADLADTLGLSRPHLQRLFKAGTGLSIKAYERARRVERLKFWLRQAESVTDAVYEAGFGSGSRVYEQANGRLGMTPAAYRRGGTGTSIRYTTAASPLGRLLVAMSERGVCAISLGDDDEALIASLHEELPAAEITHDDRALRPTLEAVIAHLNGAQPDLHLPLDVQATAFQELVWQCLRAIPYGITRSYGEVAAALDRPEAARAVAGACSRNRLALAIPCHRVVAGSGAAGGYRWGAERKQALLDRERVQASDERSAEPAQ